VFLAGKLKKMQVRRVVTRNRSVLWASQRNFCNFVPADMPVVKKKWRSVEIVGKITETMRNVAAGKLPSSEKFLSKTRPFSASVGHMLETSEPVGNIGKHLHLVVGCERGLCGVVGANLPKNVTKIVREGVKEGKVQQEVIVLGKKTTSKMKATLPDELSEGFGGMKTKMPTYGFCLEVTDRILSTREFDRCTVYYNVFKSTSSFKPAQIELYNLDISRQIAKIQFPCYDVEGDSSTIIQNLQEFKFASTMYTCMAEQLASEMGSRLASMDSAAKSCKEKARDFEMIYQRLRKTKITNELTVLSAGAKLAKKK